MANADVLTKLQHTYNKCWQNISYHVTNSDKEVRLALHPFLNKVKIKSFADLGCGNGKATREAVKLFNKNKLNVKVYSVDIVKVGDTDTIIAPLWKLPFSDAFISIGFCCDVMEHIPPHLVTKTLTEIKRCCSVCYFNIALFKDILGPVIVGRQLHLSVHNGNWWVRKMQMAGFKVITTPPEVKRGALRVWAI